MNHRYKVVTLRPGLYIISETIQWNNIIREKLRLIIPAKNI